MTVDHEKISRECFDLYKGYILTPKKALSFLISPLNHDLGGVLSVILSGKLDTELDIARIDYEIIKLKVYNKLMEKLK